MKLALLVVSGLVVVGCAAGEQAKPAAAPLAIEAAMETRFTSEVATRLEQTCAATPDATLARVALYGKACTASDADGCLKAGVLYMCGKGVARNAEIAQSLYDKACALHEEQGCQLAAHSRIGGPQTLRDFPAAIAQLDASCTRGTAPACGEIGSALLMSERPEMQKQGLVRVERACNLGYDESCSNVAVAAVLGVGGPKNIPKAVAVAKAACARKSASSCGDLGLMELEGIGMPKDAAAAKTLLTMSCDGGVAKSCLYLARMQTDPAVAAELVKKSCDGGFGSACRILADAATPTALVTPASSPTSF